MILLKNVNVEAQLGCLIEPQLKLGWAMVQPSYFGSVESQPNWASLLYLTSHLSLIPFFIFLLLGWTELHKAWLGQGPIKLDFRSL
jgi:hypothetical protein